MDITVRIPDDLASRLGTAREVGRRALEALALEEYRLGRLTKPDVQRLLGIDTHQALGSFLSAHNADADSISKDAHVSVSEIAIDDRSRMLAHQAAANIVARRKGTTLGDLTIEDLINEGRP